jgi:hypothetical protein
MPLPVLFPALVCLIHPGIPAWLKPHIATPLSKLPMRENGVRQTIEFLANTVPRDSEPSGSGTGPVLPLKTLEHITKLLSSVPSDVGMEEYFASIGSQLLDLLDDPDPDNQRASAHTIGQGILNRSVSGVPGTAGWKHTFQPLVSIIKPVVITSRSHGTESVVNSQLILQALNRLSKILMTFPNPGLVKRLLRPLQLPLWGIASHGQRSSEEYKISMQILERHIQVSAGVSGLLSIIENIMYNGELGWKYSRDISKKVEIVQSGPDSNTEALSYIQNLPQRVHLLMFLVDGCEDNEISILFSEVLKRWLSGGSTQASLNDTSQEKWLKVFTYATITQELANKHRSKIATDPSQILTVMREILQSYIHFEPQQSQLSKEKLASITSDQNQRTNHPEELEEILSTCLPLLTTVLQEADFDTSKLAQEQIEALKPVLQAIVGNKKLPLSARKSSKALVNLLSKEKKQAGKEMAPDDNTRDADEHQDAISKVTSDEPAIRAHGLHIFEKLITQRSPTVSLQSITVTLVSVLQDSESYVYLTAIRVLVAVAKQDAKTVFKSLQDTYRDVTESSTIDVRLRVGEALQKVLDELEGSAPDNSLQALCETVIYMASRRVYRPKTHDIRQKEEQLKLVTDADAAPEDSDEDSDSASRDRIVKILEGWQGRGGEEDIRIRSSALAVLGTAIEHSNLAVLTQILSPSLDLIHNILTFETTSEGAILRRASVLLVQSLLKALENAETSDDQLSVSTAPEAAKSLEDINQLLQSLSSSDEDDIVRGHAQKVAEEIEEWRVEKIARVLRGDDIRFGLEDKHGKVKLRGIDVKLPDDSVKRKPKIEEIE